MLTKRVAAVLIPRFATALFCRENPTWLLESVVLVEDDTDTAAIIEVNGKAAKTGITVGMTAAQGVMLCPGLIRVTHDSKREQQETTKICDLLRRVVPQINAVGSGCFVTESEGFEHLYGGETQLAQRLIEAVKSYGLPVQIGIADNQFAAKVAAEISRGFTCTIVPSGRTHSFIQPLPVKHLPISAEFRDKLFNLGLRTIQQVAQFPANEMVERFAREGWLVSRLARGEDPDFFVPETPPDDWHEEIYLGFAIYRAEPIANYVRLLLEKLFGKLKIAGKACAQITIQLRCDDRSRHLIEIPVEKPTLSIEKFLRQLRCKLAEIDLPAGVIELGVGPIVTTSHAPKQLALPAADRRDSDDISIAATNSCQPLYPLLQYSPIPERSYQLLTQRPKARNGISQSQIPAISFCKHSLTGLRLLEPATVIEVNDRDGALRQINWCGQRRKVTSQQGPWEVSGNWWEGAFTRQYYEIETARGEALLCYFDREQQRWYMQGVFD